jgi:transposase InsO family protein
MNLERIFIDFIGPLSRTKKGHRAIMVVKDSFSKFVAFFPVRRITAEVVCEVLKTEYFKAYGIPKSLVTDNAKVFKSKRFYDFCFQWGVRRIHTTPYYSQGSLAKRVMRNLKAALKIFHHQTQDRWVQDLHLLTFPFNSAYHESTKMSPSQLFLGRELTTPLENVWELEEINGSVNEREREKFWGQAIWNLRIAQDRVTRKYNEARRDPRFRIGDTVVYRRHVLSSRE